MKLMHVNFIAQKDDYSTISEEEMDAVFGDLIRVIDAHGMFLGGGVHDYGDADAEVCEGCDEYQAQKGQTRAER